MRYLSNYQKFKESLVIDMQFQDISDLMESLNVWHDLIFSAIGAEEVDAYETFKLPEDFYQGRLTIDFLADNIEFINSLSSIGLKKSDVKSTDDFETFVNKPLKFMLIFKSNANELENPDFILVQSWNETLKKWEDLKVYKLKEDIKKFYDKLTSKTIEILDGSENYIYTTSNGNDWQLQNSDKENDIWKKTLRKEELQELVDSRKVKITII
jgi:hypothetical protein